MLRSAFAVLLTFVIAASVVTPTITPELATPTDPITAGAAANAETGSEIGAASSAADGGAASGSRDTAPAVLINELANGSSRSTSDSFFELRNWSDEPVELAGWNVYRCDAMGLRVGVGRPEADLSGVTLDPGEIFSVSKVGMSGDAHITSPFAARGFGLYLEAPGGVLADRVAVYPTDPWPTMSECSADDGANLPNTLNLAHDESWQRLSATGDPLRDFRLAPSTIGAKNRADERADADTGVVISEFAPTGPAGDSDEFVELENRGDRVEDIGGWRMFRCTATGRLTPETLQLTVAPGTILSPGERWVAAPMRGFDGPANDRYDTPFANLTTGVLVENRDGSLVDRLSVTTYGDSACQGEATKLPATLDPVAGESYQRHDDQLLVAARTPGRANATTPNAVFEQEFAYPANPTVAISELATDPPVSELPDGIIRQNFIELANYGDAPVDIGGFSIRRCEKTGIRSRELQASIPEGTILRPGDTYLAARSSTRAASSADATFPTAFNMLGTGAWIADAAGSRVDSVGVYALNEMDADNITDSPCTKGVALTTYQPDRILGESFQRSTFSGVDADDFVTGVATPGELDRVAHRDATRRVGAFAAAPQSGDDAAVRARGDDARRAGLALTNGGRGVASASVPLQTTEVWRGVSAGGPLTTRHGDDEERVDALAESADEGWGFPYLRFTVDARDVPEGGVIAWTGSTLGRAELQLSVWNEASGWRMLDAAAGEPWPSHPETAAPDIRTTASTVPTTPDADARTRVELSGALDAGELAQGTVTLLVQAGPRTIVSAPTAGFGNPDDYDFAISHFTDTQYLAESYPEVYAQLTSWIAANAGNRKIEFVTHTGDLVQNWVDAAQNDVRARREFGRASAIQSILDDAGIANSVLPGNHDNKRGVSNDLFNEHFGPERYVDTAWYGGSIAPGDNSANFSTFEHEGAKFLMLSLPYAYGEDEIAWAEGVVAEHPQFNVVVSTHEHVTPKTQWEDARRSTSSRWVSRADQLWERVIAPNRNVVMVLSGHFHGLGKIVTENAGGMGGHTVVEMLADYQEFRTDTGERATGFQRLLQIDLAAGTIDVDTFSALLGETHSSAYDYPQFMPENGRASTLSNARPWNIVDAGVTGRYTAVDDEFTEHVAFQYPKLVATAALGVSRG